VVGACSVVYEMYWGYRRGAHCGQIGVEYMVCGVLGGRSSLPHVRHSNWFSAASKVVGGGRLGVAGSYGTGYNMHPWFSYAIY
jgi:hypothetical protein